MLSIIYVGNDKINFKCDGISPKFDLVNGSVVDDIPDDVYERDIKDDVRFKKVVEKKDQNKMEKATKGGEE